MSHWLLFSDTHFVDTSQESYRWDVFSHLKELALKYHVNQIVHLGDVVDRKDKHSSVLVNRLIEEFGNLQIQTKTEIKILSGNHDKPLNGPYYWQFLSKLGIEYIIEPKLYDGIWFLPFSPNPIHDWKNLDLNKKAIFMHQTGKGVKVENDREIDSDNLPEFPKGIPVIAGDVHRHQTINGITYIGTPHPIRFSETWRNRVMVIENDDFHHPIEIWLPSIKRAILDISNSKELDSLPYKENDQVRIRYSLTANQLTDWPLEQKAIQEWGQKNKVLIASIEAVLVGDGVKANTTEQQESIETLKPEEVVRLFGESEKLDDVTTNLGLEILRNVT
jgi:DNA repair exonuclease SbcCD nuclease subunit